MGLGCGFSRTRLGEMRVNGVVQAFGLQVSEFGGQFSEFGFRPEPNQDRVHSRFLKHETVPLSVLY